MPLYPNVVEIELGRSSWKVVESLFVRGASDITHDVGVDVSASSSPHLSKLTHLSLYRIEDLEYILLSENHARNTASSTENLSLPSFPSLSTLEIMNCPDLTSMPLYPNVERIELTNTSWKVVDSLFVRGASDITHDVGVDVSASSSSPHLSKLTHLSLRRIEDLASLPEWIHGLPCLNTLTIWRCPMLGEKCKKETDEDWPKIAHIPHITILD